MQGKPWQVAPPPRADAHGFPREQGSALGVPMESAKELHLPTPGTDTHDPHAQSQAFRFPYDTAYSIQLDLMQALFRAIEERHVGVFESPTGTGKTLSLLCSTLTWLDRHRQRATLGLRANTDTSDEPDWVLAHEEAKQRRALEAQEAALRERLAAVRAHNAQRQRSTTGPTAPKRARMDDGVEDDDAFLVPVYDEQAPTPTSEPRNATEAFLTPEVRAMMEAYESSMASSKEEDVPETKPKVLYASRTHSQIAQFVHELRRTEFGRRKEPVRCISVGSRQHMCIHAGVRRVGDMFGIDAMNERCMELMESKQGGRCEFLPTNDAAGRARWTTYSDHALAYVQDMEELVQLGKQQHICPYFGARTSARQADIVTMPYHLVLQRDARESLPLTLDDNIVVLDEAHNVIDTILSTYSTHLDEDAIEQAKSHVEMYLQRFSMRLKGVNEEHVRTLQVFVRALQAFCQKQTRPCQASMTPAGFLTQLGSTVDQLNFVRLERWLKDTRIAKRMSGFAESQWKKAHPHDTRPPGSKMQAMHALEAFLLALCAKSMHGRILVRAAAHGPVRLQYLLLNPSDAFEPLLDKARAVLLLGGTMAPMSEFQQLLFHDIPPARQTLFSCGHIVPADHILGAIVATGPKQGRFEFTHEGWRRPDMLDELGGALSNYCNIVPHGMVVFFPSYSSLETTLARWRTTGALDRLATRKQLFLEPKHAKEVDQVLQDYAAAVVHPPPTSPKGALLLAVVGAKLSEGINFQDDLARCVVMVGLPFPNAQSPELMERMAFMRAQSTSHEADAGREFYLNLCMRAVNQSMGRAIRHRNDYAVFLLLDGRYARNDIHARLPGWIRGQVHVQEKFGASIGAVAKFFREKKNHRASPP